MSTHQIGVSKIGVMKVDVSVSEMMCRDVGVYSSNIVIDVYRCRWMTVK